MFLVPKMYISPAGLKVGLYCCWLSVFSWLTHLCLLYFSGATFLWSISRKFNTTATSAGGRDGWLGKYNSITREVVWVKSFGGSSTDTINSICVDGTGSISGAGNIYIFGEFSSTTFNANGANNLARFGGTDIWAAKIDPDGNTVWAVSFGSVSTDSAESIAVNKDASAVYIVGTYTAAMTFGTTALPLAGGYEGYVAKLSTTDGSVIWAIRIYSPVHDWPYTVKVDMGTTDEELVVGGLTSVSNTFYVKNASYPVAAQTGNTNWDAFVVRIRGDDGSMMWGRGIGGLLHDHVQSIDIHEATGNIYAAGYTSSQFVIINGTQYPAALTYYAPLVLSFTRDGMLRWVTVIKASNNDEVYSMSLDQASETAFVGWYKSTGAQTFGNVSMATVGNGLFSINSSGNATGVYIVAGTSYGANLYRRRTWMPHPMSGLGARPTRSPPRRCWEFSGKA